MTHLPTPINLWREQLGQAPLMIYTDQAIEILNDWEYFFKMQIEAIKMLESDVKIYKKHIAKLEIELSTLKEVDHWIPFSRTTLPEPNRQYEQRGFWRYVKPLEEGEK